MNASRNRAEHRRALRHAPGPALRLVSALAALAAAAVLPAVLSSCRSGGAKGPSIIACGDIMLGRKVASSGSGGSPFGPGLVGRLKGADLAIGNLEGPVIGVGGPEPFPMEGVILANPPAAPRLLEEAGFDAVSIANNHMMDYGLAGLAGTEGALEAVGLAFSASAAPEPRLSRSATLEARGRSVVLLAYSEKDNEARTVFAPGEAEAADRLSRIAQAIRMRKAPGTIVVVSMHWGFEDTERPVQAQVKAAHALVAAGADLVLGHHPHRFQGVEIYRGGVICYSLGNLVFDQAIPENRRSFAVRVEFSGDRPSGVELIPVRTSAGYVAETMAGGEAEDFLRRGQELCGELGSRCVRSRGSLRILLP